MRYSDLIADALTRVKELMPWHLRDRLAEGEPPLLLDIREPAEFDVLHIPGSFNVPRGVLEQACEWDFDDTVPELAARRDQEIVLICRSGNRSILAADTMLKLGFSNVTSLKTGVRGWNDYEQPLVDGQDAPVDIDDADEILAAKVRPEQRKPK